MSSLAFMKYRYYNKNYMKHTVINYVNNYFKNVEEIDHLYFLSEKVHRL